MGVGATNALPWESQVASRRSPGRSLLSRAMPSRWEPPGSSAQAGSSTIRRRPSVSPVGPRCAGCVASWKWSPAPPPTASRLSSRPNGRTNGTSLNSDDTANMCSSKTARTCSGCHLGASLESFGVESSASAFSLVTKTHFQDTPTQPPSAPVLQLNAPSLTSRRRARCATTHRHGARVALVGVAVASTTSRRPRPASARPRRRRRAPGRRHARRQVGNQLELDDVALGGILRLSGSNWHTARESARRRGPPLLLELVVGRRLAIIVVAAARLVAQQDGAEVTSVTESAVSRLGRAAASGPAPSAAASRSRGTAAAAVAACPRPWVALAEVEAVLRSDGRGSPLAERGAAREAGRRRRAAFSHRF